MRKAEIQYPYIVADIGGTNARYALVTGKNAANGRFQLTHQRTYPSAEFDGIVSATQFFMNSLPDIKPVGACLAVAGPVAGDRVKLTNLNWAFSVTEVKQALQLSKLEVINDFAAYAYATSIVDNDHLLNLKSGTAIDGYPIAVAGPGTSFGLATLLPQTGPRARHWNVISSEAAHMTLAAKTPLQAEIIKVLNNKFSHVSIEKVLSGPGIENLYQSLSIVMDETAQPLSTAQICQLAISKDDPLCFKTLSLFASWLGSICGDLALSLGARGGVFLGGGILPRITNFILESDFATAFVEKGPMLDYLRQIPVHLVTEGNSALLGAAACFEKP